MSDFIINGVKLNLLPLSLDSYANFSTIEAYVLRRLLPSIPFDHALPLAHNTALAFLSLHFPNTSIPFFSCIDVAMSSLSLSQIANIAELYLNLFSPFPHSPQPECGLNSSYIPPNSPNKENC